MILSNEMKESLTHPSLFYSFFSCSFSFTLPHLSLSYGRWCNILCVFSNSFKRSFLKFFEIAIISKSYVNFQYYKKGRPTLLQRLNWRLTIVINFYKPLLPTSFIYQRTNRNVFTLKRFDFAGFPLF